MRGLLTLLDFVLGFVSYAFNGWVLSELWKWFIIPVFKAAPTLTVAQAIGVTLVVCLLTQRLTTHEVLEEMRDEFSWESFQRRLFNNFYAPFAILFMAWVFHDFIF